MRRDDTSTRPWTGQGVADYRPGKLRKGDREKVKQELWANGITDVPEAFYGALEHAIGIFGSHRGIAATSRPTTVRETLDKIARALEEAERLVETADANSAALLRESGASVREIQGHLAAYLRTVLDAREKADEYPSRGRLPEPERVWLGVDLVKAFATHLETVPAATMGGPFVTPLKAVPTATVGGPFEFVLGKVLRAAADHLFTDPPKSSTELVSGRRKADPDREDDDGDTHDLACRAIKLARREGII
ncbi:MAG: hypothetical protein L0H73_16535 [Nitrococcus sp.]|nr:hypothetical protein [Nitrococcus sp.]